jgi:ABC-type uncharacterized transport system involved in gliding motility auxiliary subunit
MNRIVNLLGWLGTGAVGVSLFLRFQTFKPEWTQYSWGAAVAGLILILLYLGAQWREIAQAFQRRQTRLGSIAVASVLLVLGILVAVNYLASRRNYRWDLTVNKQFSLSDQTRQILQKLDSPVKALVFEKPTNFDQFRDRLGEYEYASKGKLSADYINPDKEPVRAQQNQVQSYGTVVFSYKGRTERVVGSDEQQLTNTLIKVLTGEQKKVYFLEGHGERDTTSSARDGYSTITQGLGSENFKVETVSLAQKGDVPLDATVLVIGGPKNDLLQPEIDAIKKYLDRGGKLFVMVEPALKDAKPEPNLFALLKDWGFDIGDNIVIDTNPVGQLLGTGELAPVASRYPSHPITSNFRVITAYPTARSVRAASGGANGRTPQVFVETSAAAWAETDLDAINNQKPVEPNKDKDIIGPVPLAAAVTATAANASSPKGTDGKPEADAPKPETRVAVIGDSDFATNNFLGIPGNRDLFLNVVNWLAQQENLISIRPHEPDDRRLTMTAQAQRNVTWLSWVILPVAIFGLGIYSWSRRRG